MSSNPDSPPPLISGEEGLAILRDKASVANTTGAHKVRAFYSSVLGAVTRDNSLFQVPIDDHMATRGHAVFDTCNVSKGLVYGLDFHVDRLLNSAKKARIDISEAAWLPEEAGTPSKKKKGEAEQKYGIKKLILATLAAAGERDGVYCRYWLSAARGDFSITPRNCVDKNGNFYCVVHNDPSCPEESLGSTGVSEHVVSLPLKNRYLATLKSNNYLINAICAMEAQDKTGSGASLGLQIDDCGFLAEFSIGAIAIVCADGVLRSPKQDKILASTTISRVFSLIESKLVPSGLLRSCEFANITLEDALKANEVLSVGGGHIVSVTQLNGSLIGVQGQEGKPGPVYKELHRLVSEEMEKDGTVFTTRIPYELYSS